MQAPKALVFDLGGVIFESPGLTEISKLLEDSPTPEEIRARWVGSAAVTGLQIGNLTPNEFAEAFLAEWPLSIQPKVFLSLFRSWSGRPFAGAREILATLKSRFTLACLSNTNEIHWSDMLYFHDLSSMFDKLYASHVLRRLKPEPKVYRMVAEDLDCDPTEIVFFDDDLANVRGARGVGMAAHQVRGITELRTTLLDLHFLSR